MLDVAPGELDLERFRELAEQGRDALAAGNAEEAATVLREGLKMWRAPPLAEFAYEPFAQPVIGHLEELHLAAVEDRVDADLALGRARELVGELRDLVARHPLQERLRGSSCSPCISRGGRPSRWRPTRSSDAVRTCQCAHRHRRGQRQRQPG